MTFGLRIGTSPDPIKIPASVDLEGPGFFQQVPLPPAGSVVVFDYPTSISRDFTIALRFHAANDLVRMRLDHLNDGDRLFVMAEPNQLAQQITPGVRFVGTIWHFQTQAVEEQEHCEVTCEEDQTKDDCCVECTSGSTVTKICC